MGRLEKIVVLTVLFLVAVILGVSLNTEQGMGGPVDGQAPVSNQVAQAPGTPPMDPGPGRRAEPQPVRSAAQDGPRGLLNLGTPTTPSLAPVRDSNGAADSEPGLEVASSVEPLEAPRARLAEGGLRTTSGLVASPVDDYKIYTWAEGDTFTALADRYYGSRLHVARLRSANEGRDETNLRAGDRILVPCGDLGVEAPAAAVVAAGDGSTYRVQAGDILGTISQKVYGSARYWRRIYDANRDLLDDPNDLRLDMVLRIPAAVEE